MPVVMLLVFALTLFCSACLLFLIEPMVGKMMLPLLGGTPAVWNTCMVFFQAVLLAGYAYSHYTTTWLGTRKQARLQLFILLLPILSFVVNMTIAPGILSPNEKFIAGREGNPIPALLLVLTVSVGLPMFVVCTSAPLLQRWFSSTDHPAARDPYFLYGASNFGSMLMLIGYPLVVEPNLTLQGQQIVWVVGYGLLSVLVAVCAFMMWKAKPAAEESSLALAGDAPVVTPAASDAIRPGTSPVTASKPAPAPAKPAALDADRPVDWTRRLYWTALAIVPSSLMLGATTYITTDIAAIPLLWVLPLTLYLVTFIIVFQTMSAKTQSYVTIAGVALTLLLVCGWLAPLYLKDKPPLLWLVNASSLGLFVLSFQLLKIEDDHLVHHVMVMVMPLLVLLLIFMILSSIKPDNVLVTILIHLVTMFVVSMVCHGELARDRPTPKYLTEFFLIMSVGGVLGGLFNALFAPVAFDSLVEYTLMMAVACLLLPPLGVSRDGGWARVADIALGVVFLVVGGLLLTIAAHSNYYAEGARLPEDKTAWQAMTSDIATTLTLGPWKWNLAGLLMMTAFGLWAIFRKPAAPKVDDVEETRTDRLLDLLLPAALIVLIVGLYLGLPTGPVEGRLRGFAKYVGLEARQLRVILTFGLPAVLCYTFVERSVRFGLGVGVLLLVSNFCLSIHDRPLFQERSFFGVLRVEEDFHDKDGYRYYVHRLVHGTTLHGKQFTKDDLRDIPLTYYHRTGPVGQIFRAYNTDPKRAFATIGLGTGSMATYGLPGQTVDFYDIDAKVVDIAFDSSDFFTFTEDARDRGVDISLVLGDARLTFEPKGLKERLRPLGKNHTRDNLDSEGNLKPVADRTVHKREYGKPIPEDFKYRLIVVDAFSSDAIPVHLITKQAVKIYFDRLEEDGVCLMHISNRHLDLQPVLANIATELGVVGYHLSDGSQRLVGKTSSHWVALTRKKENMEKVLRVPAWYNDGEQLAMLGAACLPSPTPSLMANSGVALAYWAITREKTALAHKEEGGTGDPQTVDSGWLPLDTASQLAGQVAESRAVIKRLTPIRDELTKKAKPYEDGIKKVREPFEEAEKAYEDRLKEMRTRERALKLLAEPIRLLELERKELDAAIEGIDFELKGLPAAIEAAGKDAKNAEIVADLKKKLGEQTERLEKLRKARDEAAPEFVKRIEKAKTEQAEKEPLLKKQLEDVTKFVKELEPKFKKAQEEFEKVETPRAWYESRVAAVQKQIDFHEGLIAGNEKAVRINKRVAVWTDDYSNLLSVFKWDD